MLQPDQKTENTAITNGVEAGNLTIPDKSSSARVQVTSPTSVLVINRSTTADGGAILFLLGNHQRKQHGHLHVLYRVRADGAASP
ncbi:MAG: hypothetical protein R3A10_16075 [Caldilineaceae bacterium]